MHQSVNQMVVTAKPEVGRFCLDSPILFRLNTDVDRYKSCIINLANGWHHDFSRTWLPPIIRSFTCFFSGRTAQAFTPYYPWRSLLGLGLQHDIWERRSSDLGTQQLDAYTTDRVKPQL